MSDARRESFEVEERVRVELNLPSGEAAFLPGESGVVEVSVKGRQADEFVVESDGSRISLRTPESSRSRWDSFAVAVRMPAGCGLQVRAASADVTSEVDLGSLNVDVASGHLGVGNVEGDAAVRSASGNVEIGAVGGDATVNTASGDIKLREAKGRTVLNNASGDVRLKSALDALSVSTQSGDLDIGRYEGEDLECNSTSGDVRIGLPPGRNLEVDLDTVSGDIRSDFPPEDGGGATARLRVKTISGDIALVRATDQ